MKYLTGILILSACLCLNIQGSEKNYWPLEINHVLLNRIELALNSAERSRGLMHRTRLAPEEGMLFLFPKEEVVSFWMKNTMVPLDIIFLDSNDRIIALHSMPIEPQQSPGEDETAYENRLPSYSSGKPAAAALELKKGMIQFLQLKTGMKIPLNRKCISRPVY